MSMSYGDELNYDKIRLDNFELLAKDLNLQSEIMYSILSSMTDEISDIAFDVSNNHKILYHDALCYDGLVKLIAQTEKN